MNPTPPDPARDPAVEAAKAVADSWFIHQGWSPTREHFYACKNVKALTDLVERCIRQHYAPLLEEKDATIEDYQRMIDNRWEHRFVDMTPDEDLDARILEAYIEETKTVTQPPRLGELLNQWRDERNAILRRAVATLRAAKEGAL